MGDFFLMRGPRISSSRNKGTHREGGSEKRNDLCTGIHLPNPGERKQEGMFGDVSGEESEPWKRLPVMPSLILKTCRPGCLILQGGED